MRRQSVSPLVWSEYDTHVHITVMIHKRVGLCLAFIAIPPFLPPPSTPRSRSLLGEQYPVSFSVVMYGRTACAGLENATRTCLNIECFTFCNTYFSTATLYGKACGVCYLSDAKKLIRSHYLYILNPPPPTLKILYLPKPNILPTQFTSLTFLKNLSVSLPFSSMNSGRLPVISTMRQI